MKIVNRNMQKLLVFMALLFFINDNFCQSTPPLPPPTHGRNTDYPTSTPIGTATGLMISFGAGFLAYKVNIAKKNDRNKNS